MDYHDNIVAFTLNLTGGKQSRCYYIYSGVQLAQIRGRPLALWGPPHAIIRCHTQRLVTSFPVNLCSNVYVAKELVYVYCIIYWGSLAADRPISSIRIPCLQ